MITFVSDYTVFELCEDICNLHFYFSHTVVQSVKVEQTWMQM